MSIIFDPADRGASQNAAQGNVAQGGAAQNGAAQEIPASVRNAMELNPNAAQNTATQSAGAHRAASRPPLLPPGATRSTPPKSSRSSCSSLARVP